MGPGPVDGTRGFASNLWNMLADGGEWGVPRSGLLFTKRGETLALTTRMPWQQDMGGTKAEWHAYQQEDIRGIREMFDVIGILVVDETLFDNSSI